MGKTITIAISNMKGGVGKTMTAASLAAGLAKQGKHILCLDTDPQNSLTISFGISKPENLSSNLSTMMFHIINQTDIDPHTGILHCWENVDLLPSNNTLAGVEITLSGLIGRETILRQYLEKVKPFYDYIIIDCAPSLNLLTINALVAADSVIIPVTPKYLDAKGLELLLTSIAQIRRQINPFLSISGILLTMVDRRAHFIRSVISLIENTYGNNIRIFSECIPCSVRAAESTANGISIFKHDPYGKVTAAYAAITREVLKDVT